MNTVVCHECIILSFVVCVAVTEGTVAERPKPSMQTLFSFSFEQVETACTRQQTQMKQSTEFVQITFGK